CCPSPHRSKSHPRDPFASSLCCHVVPRPDVRPTVSFDLDRGRRAARAEVDAVHVASLAARHRLRVEGTRWQGDWKVSEDTACVLALPVADARAVDDVLHIQHAPIQIRPPPASVSTSTTGAPRSPPISVCAGVSAVRISSASTGSRIYRGVNASTETQIWQHRSGSITSDPHRPCNLCRGAHPPPPPPPPPRIEHERWSKLMQLPPTWPQRSQRPPEKIYW
ncbi:unnamed protein product, partial [Urochloa humidicola]